ncbi:hypothetical protein, partial [Klebsiella pneumoniae]|uniref:hypothetical protein n=1 Tax=Klebsiella pneumoniae TaxID=573 RepID=UPI001D0D1352
RLFATVPAHSLIMNSGNTSSCRRRNPALNNPPLHITNVFFSIAVQHVTAVKSTGVSLRQHSGARLHSMLLCSYIVP